MKEKKEILETAIDEIKACTAFENKLEQELGLHVCEIQPSMSAGKLFDCVAELTLNEQGQDILYTYLFPIMEEYNEDNPFKIEVSGETIEIHNNKELLDFFDKYGYFLK